MELFTKILSEIEELLEKLSKYQQALILIKVWQATHKNEDLNRAWEMAKQNQFFELQTEIVRSLAESDPEEALNKTKTIEEPHWRDIACVEIIRKNKTTQCKNEKLIKEVLDLIESKYHKALALLEVGKIEEVLEIMNSLPEELKIKLLILVATISEKKKYLNLAFKIAKKQQLQGKDCFLKEIAISFAKIGDYHKARKIAHKIERKELKLEAFCEIEARSYDPFNLNLLIFHIKQNNSDAQKSRLFEHLATALARAERIERALEVTEKIPLSIEKEETLKTIVEIAAEKGLLIKAEQILKQIENPLIKLQAQIKYGKFAKEIKILEAVFTEIKKIEDPKLKAKILTELLQAISNLSRRL